MKNFNKNTFFNMIYEIIYIANVLFVFKTYMYILQSILWPDGTGLFERYEPI